MNHELFVSNLTGKLSLCGANLLTYEGADANCVRIVEDHALARVAVFTAATAAAASPSATASGRLQHTLNRYLELRYLRVENCPNQGVEVRGNACFISTGSLHVASLDGSRVELHDVHVSEMRITVSRYSTVDGAGSTTCDILSCELDTTGGCTVRGLSPLIRIAYRAAGSRVQTPLPSKNRIVLRVADPLHPIDVETDRTSQQICSLEYENDGVLAATAASQRSSPRGGGGAPLPSIYQHPASTFSIPPPPAHLANGIEPLLLASPNQDAPLTSGACWLPALGTVTLPPPASAFYVTRVSSRPPSITSFASAFPAASFADLPSGPCRSVSASVADAMQCDGGAAVDEDQDATRADPDAPRCGICLTAPARHSVTPCGHAIACDADALQSRMNLRTCPLCRVPIQGWIAHSRPPHRQPQQPSSCRVEASPPLANRRSSPREHYRLSTATSTTSSALRRRSDPSDAMTTTATRSELNGGLSSPQFLLETDYTYPYFVLESVAQRQQQRAPSPPPGGYEPARRPLPATTSSPPHSPPRITLGLPCVSAGSPRAY